MPVLHQRTRELLAGNRGLFAAWAAGRDDIAFTATDWGTTVCVRPTRIGAERLCAELREHEDVSLVPGRFFEMPDHARVSLCTEPEVLAEGLTRIGRVLGR